MVAGLEQPVSFFSEGVRLSGTLALPSTKRDAYKVLVLAHGYANSRDEMGGFSTLASVLAGAGYASLRFDCRGCGSSGGTKGQMIPATEWVADLISAVSYLHTRAEIDAAHIGAVGISMGGANVVHAGALDPRLRCIVSLCPVANGRRWAEWLWTQNLGREAWENFSSCVERDRAQRALTGRSEFVSIPKLILAQTPEGLENWQRIASQFPEFRSEAPWESMDSVLHWYPVDQVHRLAPRPVRLIHGRADPLVSWTESQDLFDHAGEIKDLQLVESADHALLVGPCQEKTRALILEWVDAYL